MEEPLFIGRSLTPSTLNFKETKNEDFQAPGPNIKFLIQHDIEASCDCIWYHKILFHHHTRLIADVIWIGGNNCHV